MGKLERVKGLKMEGLKGQCLWRLYKNAWIFLEESKEKLLSSEEADVLLRQRGLMVRNTYDFDTKEKTSFWFVIKDTIEDISELPFSARRNIRISQRKYTFVKINKEKILEIGHSILTSARKSYKAKSSKISESEFQQMIETYENENVIDYWSVVDKESGEIVAFSINRLKENSCEYDFMSCKSEALRNRSYPYYGLIYEMNRHYLEEKKMKYVSDGSRTITEHSDVQDFLIHNFRFRKAYCRLKVHYKRWLNIVVKILFPFRKLIPCRNIRAILKMEEYSKKYNHL